MRHAKPLFHCRTLRNLCLALYCGLVLVVAAPHAPAPAKAGKAAAPAPAPQTAPTSDSCAPPPPGAPAPAPNICGKWEYLVPLKTVPVHISLLPNGRILYWGRDKAIDHPPPTGCAPLSDGSLPDGCDHWDVGNKSYTYTWNNPTEDRSGYGHTYKNTTTNLFCSGHSFLPDGRLLVTGGHTRDNVTPWAEIGETDVNIFNNGWTHVGTMQYGRWYPSNVTLATGQTAIISGSYWDGVTMSNGEPKTSINKTVDLFRLNGILRPVPFDDGRDHALELYPYLHLAPDGRVFIAGPVKTGSFPDQVAKSIYFNPATGGFEDNGPAYVRPRNGGAHEHHHGSAVTYDAAAGKVMMVGGQVDHDEAAVNTVQTINLLSDPFWKSSLSDPPGVTPMNVRRQYHTATVLPDGKVLVTGGTQCEKNSIDCVKDTNGNNLGAVTRPELWTPPTGTAPDAWKLLARSTAYPDYPNGIPRVYHSVALLLPDARVLVGGGGLPAADGERVNNKTCMIQGTSTDDPDCLKFGHKDVELFSPPYLFNADGSAVSEANGTRPVITSTPASVFLGQSFNVGLSSASPVGEVVLIRLPSVTHGFNFDQRRIVLNYQQTSGTTLSVTAPADARVCPPGHYMLFILNSNKVPSKARIIQVQRYEGTIDAINCEQIRGWAWDSNQPNATFDVNLLFKTLGTPAVTHTATVPANLFRQDLLNAGKGNGFHGFAYDVPLSMKDGRTYYISASIVGTEHPLSLSRTELMCPGSLFPTQIPESVASAEGRTWEQATQFSSSANGLITHVAFYKAEGETGTHVGRIWNESGVLLAQVTFTNETPSGWQKQALPTALSITAGVKYRVSYNVNSFGAKTFAGLNTPITSGLLTAHTSYYSTPAGTFPNTNSGSILFADIGFRVFGGPAR